MGSATLRAILDGQVSERSMQQAIMDAARLGGWLAYHTHDARRSPEGFPDVLAVRGGELLALELKTQQGRVSPAQAAWLHAFAEFSEAHGLAGYMEARVVRPADMAACIERLCGGKVL